MASNLCRCGEMRRSVLHDPTFCPAETLFIQVTQLAKMPVLPNYSCTLLSHLAKLMLYLVLPLGLLSSGRLQSRVSQQGRDIVHVYHDSA